MDFNLIKLERQECDDRRLYDVKRDLYDERINITPTWQRREVWKLREKSLLIESILVNYPIPNVYTWLQNGKEQVVDGKQRLITINQFMSNEFALVKTDKYRNEEFREYLIGKKFKELSEDLKSRIENYKIRICTLPESYTIEDIRDLFYRLNTGGTPLNMMEIMNCMYPGELLTLAKELADEPSFLKSLGINNDGDKQKALYKRMEHIYWVVRFLALSERELDKNSNNTKKHVDEFMDRYKHHSRKDLERHLQQDIMGFKKAINVATHIFGEHTWNYYSPYTGKKINPWSTTRNINVFQAIAYGIAKSDYKEIDFKGKSLQINEKFIDLCVGALEDENSPYKWLDCMIRATHEHNRLTYGLDKWKSIIENAMSDVPLIEKDKQRCYSLEDKKYLYERNDKCTKCGDKIQYLELASVDHNADHAIGGKTDLDNARLMHRDCNLFKVYEQQRALLQISDK